jgi:hypothetical protein
MRSSHKVVAVLFAGGVAVAAAWVIGRYLPAGKQGDPVPLSVPGAPKPPKILSPEMPGEVDFEGTDDGEKAHAFFDDFAWREFIALNWPAREGVRGEPDAELPLGDTSRPTVWGSWRSAGELFPPDAATNPPPAWESDDRVPAVWPSAKDGKRPLVPLKDLSGRREGRNKVLTRVSKLQDVNEAGLPTPGFPLVAQNKTYVRYEVRVNRLEYDLVRDRKLYLAKNLPGEATPLEFPDHSVTAKAAWMILPKDSKDKELFYRVPAKLLDWDAAGNPVLEDCEVGLVGLHIVQKTPKRKNWVWATFEHVNNLESGPGGKPAPLFCSPDGAKPFGSPGTNVHPPKVEAGKPIPKDTQPVEVARNAGIHQATQEANAAYQSHPQIRVTVWRNYRLVAVQWPQAPGDVFEKRFPDRNVANVTLETYIQGSGCINCHIAATHVRFSFFPSLRAVGDASGPSPVTTKAARDVRALLRRAADPNVRAQMKQEADTQQQ